MSEYMDDCIHLHACRRLCKIANINNRGCNEKCTAYQDDEEFLREIGEYEGSNLQKHIRRVMMAEL